jgi:FixJ family two-component response regulator
MPLKSGLDATKEVLAFDSSIRIIFVSADSSVREEALLAGAVAFIQKPFDIDALLGLLSLQESASSLLMGPNKVKTKDRVRGQFGRPSPSRAGLTEGDEAIMH